MNQLLVLLQKIFGLRTYYEGMDEGFRQATAHAKHFPNFTSMQIVSEYLRKIGKTEIELTPEMYIEFAQMLHYPDPSRSDRLLTFRGMSIVVKDPK
jgi:hypothetical protein